MGFALSWMHSGEELGPAGILKQQIPLNPVVILKAISDLPFFTKFVLSPAGDKQERGDLRSLGFCSVLGGVTPQTLQPRALGHPCPCRNIWELRMVDLGEKAPKRALGVAPLLLWVVKRIFVLSVGQIG